MQIATQKENEKDQTRDEQDSDSSMFEGTDCVTDDGEVISTREPASAILNIAKNSQVKKCTAWYLTSQASVKLDIFNDYQKVDIMILLVHSCSDEVKTLIGEKGIQISPIPRKSKRMHFSGMATTSKYFQKDQLKELLEQYELEIAANWYVKTFNELSKVSRA